MMSLKKDNLEKSIQEQIKMTEEQSLAIKTVSVIVVAMVFGGAGLVSVLWGVIAGLAFGASILSVLKVVGAGLGLLAIPAALYWYFFRR